MSKRQKSKAPPAAPAIHADPHVVYTTNQPAAAPAPAIHPGPHADVVYTTYPPTAAINGDSDTNFHVAQKMLVSAALTASPVGNAPAVDTLAAPSSLVSAIDSSVLCQSDKSV
jgi:hypothetical protein